MPTYRKTAVIIGILFLFCTGATLLSFAFTGAILESPDYIANLAGNEGLIITGALLEFVWAASCTGIAIGFYPVLRKHNRALALGAVGFRTIEGVFVLAGTLALLALLSLSREFVSGALNTVSLQAVADSLLAARFWAHNVILSLAFPVGASMYYFVLYKSRLVPRWLSGWGLLGAALSLIATVLSSYTGSFGMNSVNTYLNLPIGLNELVLAVWLIARGFDSSAAAYPASE